MRLKAKICPFYFQSYFPWSILIQNLPGTKKELPFFSQNSFLLVFPQCCKKLLSKIDLRKEIRALHRVAESADYRHLQMLIENNADIDAPDRDG